MGAKSHYILPAVERWRDDLAALSAPEKPLGMYGLEVTVYVYPQNGPTIRHAWYNDTYDFEFTWRFDERDEPSSGEIVIYNLSDETIRSLAVGDTLRVLAGYNADCALVALASITGVSTVWKGPDKVVTISLSDLFGLPDATNPNKLAGMTWQNYTGGVAAISGVPVGGKQVSVTYHAGVRASRIVHELCQTSGLPVLEMSLEADRVYQSPVVVEGPLFGKLCEYAAVCGATAYLANGMLVVRDIRINHQTDAVLVNQNTGLIDSPAPFTEQGKNGGAALRGYVARMLANPRMRMGAPVRLESRNVNATFTVLRGKHSFDGKQFVTEATLIE